MDDLQQLETAAEIIYQSMPATPQYRWPLLCEKIGTEIWVKHENYTPVGAFKIRGGLVYFHYLAQQDQLPSGVISATRGNHGQSIAFAAARFNVPVTIVVPEGNSTEKNAAMRALGAELIEYGQDFQEAREHAQSLAEQRKLTMIPSFHPQLVRGVATYSLELLRAVPDLDVVYIPIGLGSGVCGMLAAKQALQANVTVVGVVSSHATAYADSFQAGRAIEAPANTQLADGMACRVTEPQALQQIIEGVDRIVTVSDEEIAHAIQTMFSCTHSICEGAGAAALAAAIQEASLLKGKKVAVVATGANIDKDMLASVLQSP